MRYFWPAHERADPMMVVLLVVFGTAAAFATWLAFGIALRIEVLRSRRRRFGDAPTAWETGPTPPT